MKWSRAFMVRGVFLVLPFCIGIAAAYAATGVVSLWLANAPRLAETSNPAAPRNALFATAEVIRSKNILALHAPAQEPGSGAEAPALTDPASWVVNGVLVRPSKSVAMVLAMKEIAIVFQGEPLHGWTLIEVRPTGVRWRRGAEERETLLADAGTNQPRRDRPGGISVQRLPSANFSARIQLDRAALGQYLQDPVALLKEALYKPEVSDGKTVGFKISNIKDSSVLNQIGIKNDDVLVRMNGEAVQTPTSLLSAYSGIAESKTVTLDVLRDGKMQSILLELK